MFLILFDYDDGVKFYTDENGQTIEYLNFSDALKTAMDYGIEFAIVEIIEKSKKEEL